MPLWDYDLLPTSHAGRSDSEPGPSTTSSGNAGLTSLSISGRDNPCRDFLRDLPTCSSSLRDLTRAQLTTQPGKSGIPGVLEDKTDPLSATLSDVLEFLAENFKSGLQ